jgi:hypothetical protein
VVGDPDLSEDFAAFDGVAWRKGLEKARDFPSRLGVSVVAFQVGGW